MRSKEEILKGVLKANRKVVSEFRAENRILKQQCRKYQELIKHSYRWFAVVIVAQVASLVIALSVELAT